MSDFDARFDDGFSRQMRVASLLCERGLDVLCMGKRRARTKKERDDFRTSVDLWLYTNMGPTLPIEVKGKFGEKFKTPLDFRFKDVLLYAASKGIQDMPVLIECAETGTVLGVCDDGKRRTIKSNRDPKRGTFTDCYFVPSDELLELDDWVATVKRRWL